MSHPTPFLFYVPFLVFFFKLLKVGLGLYNPQRGKNQTDNLLKENLDLSVILMRLHLMVLLKAMACGKHAPQKNDVMYNTNGLSRHSVQLHRKTMQQYYLGCIYVYVWIYMYIYTYTEDIQLRSLRSFTRMTDHAQKQLFDREQFCKTASQSG